MNNTIKLSSILLMAVILMSCSMVGLGNNSKATNSNTTATKTSVPEAKIRLKEIDDQIKITIHTTYNNNPNGSVELEWVAPEGTNCYNTGFPIKKYGEENDMTSATVNTKHGNKECNGAWTANIKFNGNIIATDTIMIK
ncbi:TUL4 family lipoprotein [Francisella sp. SYW-2]|uniref:TUL4 family lipoprotein n=1 Tax=Francisella sp. SYW-2 TaxID=2610886 RepID=UPI00123E16F1|nr:TUL4 family lipoprotein [Francisella sp. SYW-2]